MLKLLMADWLHADVKAIPIREAVFIKEQKRAETEEWDDGDEHALHVVASFDGNAIGTARLTPDGIIGHMAVLKDFRNQGVGSAMLQKLIEMAKQSRFKLLTVNCPHRIEYLYIKHGFMAQGDKFLQAGEPHIKMVLYLSV